MQPDYGIHLGLVINHGPDPEKRNRVQVWIPYLSNTLYTDVNANLQDLHIKGTGDLSPTMLQTLMGILPWAECGSPLIGGSSGLYNNSTGKTATTDQSTVAPYNNQPPALPQTTTNMTLSAIKPDDTKSKTIFAGPNSGPTLNTVGEVNGYLSNQINSMGFGSLKLDPTSAARWGIDTSSPEAQAATMTNLMEHVIASESGYNTNASSVEPSGNSSNGLLQFTAGDRYTVDKSGASNSGSSGNTALRANPAYNIDTGLQNIYYSLQNNGGNIDALGPNNGDIWAFVGHGPSNIYGRQIPTDSSSIRNPVAQDYSYKNGKTGTVIASDGSATSDPNALNNKSPVEYVKNGSTMNRYIDVAAVGGVRNNTATAGSGVGTFSVPNAGTYVWVFFSGGDVQKPVYFSKALNPSDIAAMNG